MLVHIYWLRRPVAHARVAHLESDMFSFWVLLLISAASGQGFYETEDTLFRDQVPSRPPSVRPVVSDPYDYDVYFDPVYAGPQSVGPLVAPIVTKPPFIPKPFEPRPPKQVKQLQPNGPLLHSSADQRYATRGPYQPSQDLTNVPGYPGQDYPVFAQVPPTKFSCEDVPVRPGLYADQDTGCQAYHVCGEDGRHGYAGAAFLCTNGTVFNQYLLTCDWWFNVDCSQARAQYEVNLDPYKNPLLYVPEKQDKRAQTPAGSFYENAEFPARQTPYQNPF